MSTTTRTGRSPSYPAFDLREAVGRLDKYYDQCKKHPVSLDTAYKGLGYSSANGAAKRTLAAMRAYGLVDGVPGDEGMVRLSTNGDTIVSLSPDNPEWWVALKESAARPKIFRELLDAYAADMPGDAVLQAFLHKREYNRDAIPSVIAVFKATYDYAKLGETVAEDDRGAVDDEESNPKGDGPPPPPPPPSGQFRTTSSEGMLLIPVPLGPNRFINVEVPTDVNEGEIALFEQVWKIYLGSIILKKPSPPPMYRAGEAVWHREDGVEEDITVTGYAGYRDGRHYVTVKDSTTGVPFDQIVYVK